MPRGKPKWGVRVGPIAAGLALLLWGASASAQKELVPPHPAGPIGAAYPSDARGEAAVVLELLVDAQGAVSEARVLEGVEPFAGAALRAAETWLFEPARREGKSVAARIRFEVRFYPPVPAAEPSAAAPPPVMPPPSAPVPPVAPPPPVAREPVEVLVTGERAAPGASSLSRAEVRQLPGAFGDPFRAIEAMPGVTPILTGLPYFFVRGAPPGNVGYFLDGIRVPLLYHVGLGPSVVQPAMVERVDLYPGGYPARYGRFAGGIVAGETTPPRYELHGEGSLRLVDVGGLVEAPIGNARGSALAGGRYSYTTLLLGLIAEEVILEYWDYQARIAYETSSSDTLSAFAFGSFDRLGEEEDRGGDNVYFASEFHRLDLRYDHAPSTATKFRLAGTLGVDRTRLDDNDVSARDRMLALRAELRHRTSSQLTVRGGIDTTADFYDVDVDEEQFAGSEPREPSNKERIRQFFPSRLDIATGVWSDLVLDPEPGVTVTPGLRVDLYASGGATAIGIDPRISARFEVSPKLALLHAFGIAHQPPSFVAPLPGFQPGRLEGGLQRSLQASSGLELELPEDFIATATVFDNVFLDMTDVIGTARGQGDDIDEIDEEIDQLLNRSLGSTIGLELYVRRPLTRRLGGFVSYTLSRSTRSIGAEHFPARSDRTHVFNLALAYDLGKNWRAGTRFVFYTGFPAEDLEVGRPRSEHPSRVRAFYRIDLRLEKRWRLGKNGSWAFVVDLLNATLNREVIALDCGSGRCVEEEIGPVTLPSIGVEAVF
jgi:TonB family protein